MEGKEEGESLSVILPPEQAYGQRKLDAIQRVPAKRLMGAKKWKPGMIAQVNTEKGPRHVLVTKVGHKFIDVDTIHPLAGRTLTFDIEIISLREAEAEEISHGHAHGAGGHNH
jgi:FKBP-type peptidyl-prolyl cis-trans isomerase SlyD